MCEFQVSWPQSTVHESQGVDSKKVASILSLQTGYFPDDMAAEYQERKQVTAQNRREFRLDFVNTDLIK